ncbi:MAG TPA: phosphotransferase family protein [Sphingorhabdus sp.]|jgi:aminoglycoside phosphotransferase (APT) family kinase protein|nr:phosphotransferase family protein [Sphingorhabdus sp.]
MEEFENKLAVFAGHLRRDGVLANVARLSGGANMESWSFDVGDQGYILRRAPSDALMEGRVFGHDVEAALVRAAFAAGVKAPEIVGELEDVDGLGTGYLMRRIEAEVNPAKILSAPPTSLLSDLASELAKIHAIPLAALPDLASTDAQGLLSDIKTRFLDFGGDRPVMALALRWLEDCLPAPVDPVLLHGDFRMGNIMADANGLAAVLDWELAHIGDRHQDLAYGCINSWRFGHIDRPAFGLGQLEEYFAAYEAVSGVAVEPARFRWWLVYSTLWWGVCCLQMADIWRSGKDAGLERAVIGRRASETEVDLLMLLEDYAPESERGRIATPAPTDIRRLGETSATEMLEAIAGWVEADVKPNAQGRDRFMASVALNALGMLQREVAHSVDVHDKALSEDLLAGRKSIDTPGVLAQLKTQALVKLAADQPKYSALGAAIQKWSE